MKKIIYTVSLFVVIIFIIVSTFYHNGSSDATRITEINKDKDMWGFDAVNYSKEKPSNHKIIKVAVLDSGISTHKDLEGKVAKSYNTLDNTHIRDEYGHGTAIAGIITANDNDIGITGISQNIELYDVKVLNENGKGKIEDLEEGIEWCITEKVDIINISFGVQVDNKYLKETIDDAVKEGIIIVAAAGNTYGLSVDYPAKYENVLSINSINSKLSRAGSAAKGKVDYATPGEKILSTSQNGEYEYFSGTSFSTAFASGIIARKLVEFGEITSYTSYLDFMKMLEKSVIRKEPINEYGHGILII